MKNSTAENAKGAEKKKQSSVDRLTRNDTDYLLKSKAMRQRLVEADTWQVSPIDLPADAQILAWVSVTP